ncbi:oxygenase MpaB family protein [Crocosphaera sp. Alani8]|uniref:oxygenase MpaB family protein n=1 Tax=Crocosphaera sp. Alani8 TaxID=3038952 RepID=UPI00313D03AF
MSWFNLRYHRLQQIQQLNPVNDHCQICHLLAGYEFPWDITRSLELAMVKTYCIPSISQILDRTGEFHHHTQKRYDDTGLLVAEIIKWGYDSERGKESIRRMNAIHQHYPISNEDFLYVLSTFIYEPIRWNERFGWRLFCETEKLAIFYFWQKVGEKMNIKNIPSTYEKFAQYNRNYEQHNFVYSDSNRRVGESTINLFLSWFPSFTRQMLEPCVYGIFDDLTLRAFGWSKPTTFVSNLVENSLKWRGYFSRLLLPRTQSDFYTDSKLRSYPDGYKLSDIGPTKMLKELNRHN